MQAVFNSLKGLLSLRSTAVRDKAENAEEGMETSLITLGGWGVGGVRDQVVGGRLAGCMGLGYTYLPTYPPTYLPTGLPTAEVCAHGGEP